MTTKTQDNEKCPQVTHKACVAVHLNQYLGVTNARWHQYPGAPVHSGLHERRHDGGPQSERQNSQQALDAVGHCGGVVHKVGGMEGEGGVVHPDGRVDGQVEEEQVRGVVRAEDKDGALLLGLGLARG